jgi:hypothetical protein
MKKSFLGYLLISVFIIGCNKDETIPEDEFIKVYVDILVTQDTLQNKSIPPDSIRAIVLEKHNIPDSVYKKTIDYYNSSEENWEKFFDKAIKYVEDLKAVKEK